MRIAWVTPYLPEPATSGGAIRQQRLARALSQRSEVHLFARGELWEKPRLSRPELEVFASRWLGRDYLSPRPDGAPDSVPPERVRRGSPRSLWRALQKAHERVRFDGVVVAHSWAALGAKGSGLPWLLDEHNVESRFFADLASAGAKGPALARDAFERWEQAVWRDASAVTCVSEEDARRMTPHRSAAAAPLAAPLVVQNGADLDRLARLPIEQRRGGVLFVGALHHRPNLLAALHLVEHIMPRVWRTLPETRLTLVGGPVPMALNRAAAGAPGPVQVLGRVPDVTPHLASAQVFANPVTHGAGSSLKTIECLAAGLPLVSTELGARGFSLLPGGHYLRAETEDEFAAAIVLVLQAHQLAKPLPHAGRAHAERFGWQALGDAFAHHVELTFRAS